MPNNPVLPKYSEVCPKKAVLLLFGIGTSIASNQNAPECTLTSSPKGNPEVRALFASTIMTSQKNVQEVLRLMADDLQDLRANLAALAAQPCTAAVALAAKNRAIEQNHKSYASLLEKIEKLA